MSIDPVSYSSPLYQQAAASTSGESTYNQAEYLKGLNQRVNAPVIAGAWNGSSAFGLGAQPTVMIHPALLEKMHADPEVGGYYEQQINGFAESAAQSKQYFEAQGHTITSIGMYIDENGEMSSYMSGRTSGGSDTATSSKKNIKDLMTELQEKLAEKLADKKEAEKLAEKSEDKKALLESLGASATVTVLPAVFATNAST